MTEDLGLELAKAAERCVRAARQLEDTRGGRALARLAFAYLERGLGAGLVKAQPPHVPLERGICGRT